jgi:hypothetical protein
MRSLIVMICLSTCCAASAIACGATSSEEQRRALIHQQKSDDAAKQGQFGIAGDEQQNAQDAHHEAVNKAIDEGQPIPPQTKPGDVPPPKP